MFNKLEILSVTKMDSKTVGLITTRRLFTSIITYTKTILEFQFHNSTQHHGILVLLQGT